jgi:membrane fusion protein (multidrug efflux system)
MLHNRIDQRSVRAPMTGRLAEVAVLRPGAVLKEGDKLGAIVASGQLALIAQFAPDAALGRVRGGQRAESGWTDFRGSNTAWSLQVWLAWQARFATARCVSRCRSTPLPHRGFPCSTVCQDR